MAAAAASPPLPEKPHFHCPEKSSNIQQIPSKSNSNALCKTLIILILLLVIPLFPSQAPDFINQSVFTEFWEIIHLLFIGIAVSYGLFGRRTAQIVPEKIVDSKPDDYLSGISHLYSIFEDEYENLCAFDEHDGRSGNRVFSGAKNRSFSPIGENVKCSQYLKEESLVVVSNSKYFVGGSSDFKPLNLPVRSLRSNDKPVLENRDEFSQKVEANCNGNVKLVKIRGVVPLNLEKKFEDAARKSSIPWRSRSGRMKNGEEINNNPKHCRPHSVGEFEFENLKSRGFRGSKFSSSPELASSNLERKKVFSVVHPKIAPLDDDCEEEVGKGKQAIESLDSDAKSSGVDRVLSRAKSVRTIKPSRYIMNQKEQPPSELDSESFWVKRGRGEEHENHDRIFAMPKPRPSLSECHNEEKQDVDGRNVAEFEEDTDSESDKSPNEDDPRANNDNEAELEGSEVDRKAGEFIAKFREQIRLQKISFAEGYSG